MPEGSFNRTPVAVKAGCSHCNLHTRHHFTSEEEEEEEEGACRACRVLAGCVCVSCRWFCGLPACVTAAAVVPPSCISGAIGPAPAGSCRTFPSSPHASYIPRVGGGESEREREARAGELLGGACIVLLGGDGGVVVALVCERTWTVNAVLVRVEATLWLGLP